MAWGYTGIMDLSLIYKVEVPILMFHPLQLYRKNLCGERVNGYAGNGSEPKVMRLPILQIPELYIIKMQIALHLNCL